MDDNCAVDLSNKHFYIVAFFPLNQSRVRSADWIWEVGVCGSYPCYRRVFTKLYLEQKNKKEKSFCISLNLCQKCASAKWIGICGENAAAPEYGWFPVVYLAASPHLPYAVAARAKLIPPLFPPTHPNRLLKANVGSRNCS